MRIAVTDVGRTFGRQTRAYAEYRIFSSLARFSGTVRDASVCLAPSTADRHTVHCRVTVSLEHGSDVCVRARGEHAYDAINKAARQMVHALQRHSGVALSS